MSYYGGWPRYVPVAERREKARRKMKKLRKKGQQIEPIEISGRKIAKSTWGIAWCDHIESFSDYENRLPRGRTYVRNGSVCHLAIEQGKIHAMVAGSSMYRVNIKIAPLQKTQWQHIKTQCAGQIGSILDLLGGKLSNGVMAIVCDREKGLFPVSNDIKLSCSCPDGAVMCKHVAAALYGVGARLDHLPEQLFQLRGVDHQELVDVSAAIDAATQGKASKRRRLADDSLAAVFDIDLADETKTTQPKKSKTPQPIFPDYITGFSLRKKRKALGLSQVLFAKQLGVSVATVSKWEKHGRKKIDLKEKYLKNLRALWGED